MISGRECKVVNDPNREERIAHGDSWVRGSDDRRLAEWWIVGRTWQGPPYDDIPLAIDHQTNIRAYGVAP